MKIISWNCGGWSCGGLNENRLNIILINNPDIILIQEITKIEYKTIGSNYRNKEWHGDNKEESYKGISIMSNNYKIALNPKFNPKFRYVVPYDLINEQHQTTTIFSVWTKKPSDGSDNYQKQLFDAMDYYNYDKPHIVIGDFNTGSNSEHHERYKELVVNLLKKGLFNCAKETKYEFENTFYHQITHKYYTNDFCFASQNYNVTNISIPDRKEWIEISANNYRWKGLSDHCPIEIDLK